MKRILQVVSCMELGGTEAFIMNNYRVINRDEIQFDFLVFIEKNYPYTDEIQRLGGQVYYSGVPRLSQIGTFIAKVKKIISAHGPYAAVHSHVNISNAWVMFAAYLAGIPTRISHSHANSGKNKSGIRKIYTHFEILVIKKCSTHLLACSQVAGNYLYGKKYFTKYGVIISNGIDTSHFINISNNEILILKDEFNIGNSPLVLGNITRFDSNKNPLFTIDVFSHILKLEPCAILIMGGTDGGQFEIVKNKVQKLGIGDNVRFIGRRTDVPQWLQIIDTYIFPSLSEGLGIALLEAQAAGCLCIASDSVSKEVDMGLESVKFLSLTASPAVWANYIISLSENWKRPGAKTRKQAFIRSGYDIHDSSKKLMEVYNGY